MIGKGFPPKWVNWVMSTMRGGQVCINVNGERSAYLKLLEDLDKVIPYLLSCLTWWQMFWEFYLIKLLTRVT